MRVGERVGAGAAIQGDLESVDAVNVTGHAENALRLRALMAQHRLRERHNHPRNLNKKKVKNEEEEKKKKKEEEGGGGGGGGEGEEAEEEEKGTKISKKEEETGDMHK